MVLFYTVNSQIAHAFIYDDFSGNSLDATKWNLTCVSGCLLGRQTSYGDMIPDSATRIDTEKRFFFTGNLDGNYLYLIGHKFSESETLDFDFFYVRGIIGFQYGDYSSSPAFYGSPPTSGNYHMHLEFPSNNEVIWNISGVNNFSQSGKFSHTSQNPIFYTSLSGEPYNPNYGEVYYDNFIINGKDNEFSCDRDYECKSNYCVHNVCRSSKTFCGDSFCDTEETCNNCISDCNCKGDTICTPKNTCLKIEGVKCNNNSDCSTGFCVHNVCRNASTYCGDNLCDTGETCSVCQKDCGCKIGSICTSDICSKIYTGYACDKSSNCLDGFCVHGICRNQTVYCGDSFCDKEENAASCFTDCKQQIYPPIFLIVLGIGGFVGYKLWRKNQVESEKRRKAEEKQRQLEEKRRLEEEERKRLEEEKKRKLEEERRSEELSKFEKQLIEKLNLKKDDKYALEEIKKFKEYIKGADEYSRKMVTYNKIPELRRIRDDERKQHEIEQMKKHLEKVNKELRIIGPKIRDNYIHVFVKKYNKGDEKSIKNLKDLLKSKGISVEHDTLEKLISEKFKEIQLSKGLVEYKDKWVTKSQFSKLKEIDIGLDKNFMNLSPYEFEEFVAELFRKMGYRASTTPKARDKGIDIIAKGHGDIIAIQCKRNKDGINVGNQAIQMARGSMDYFGANKCIIVTNQDFTIDAKDQARRTKYIELWGRKKLHEKVRQYFIKAHN